MTAAEIAKARGGHASGAGFLIRCVCPSHGKGRGDLRPSLSIADGDEGRLLVQCFAGCDPRDVLAELRRCGLLGDDTPRMDRHPTPRTWDRPVSRVEPEPSAEAVELWASAEPIAGTLAERYLTEHRGLKPPFPASLRFSRGAPYRPAGLRLPALIAAVQRPSDRRMVAVQATFLNAASASKANVSAPRWTFGTLGTGCVRLALAGPVLGLAEGLESGLAALHLAGVPIWVVLGSQRLASVTLPTGVRELQIFADADDAGREAADKAAARHTREGRRVVLRFPPDGCGDWNDFARSLASEVAA